MDGLEDTAPLVAAVMAARARGMQPLQIPGHKWRYQVGAEGILGFDVLHALIRDDVPLQGGADDNAFSGHVLVRAEQLYAQAIGASHTRFLVGGSSQGNISALLTVAGDGDVVAVDRTSHRSALSGLVLSGAMPEWIYPTIHAEFGIPVGMPAAAVENVSGKAVFVTSPAYVGTMSNVVALAAACHADARVLVVDQAWGAHFDFGVPSYLGALAAGADIAVTSVHKALLGYTQTAIVSTSGNLVDAARLDRSVDATATTSPSATLLASIDATRLVMQQEGAAAIDRAIEATREARRLLAKVSGVVVFDENTLGCAVDPLKISIWLPRTGCTGTELADALWAEGHGIESADNDTLVMTVSIVDDPETVLAIAAKLCVLIESRRREPRSGMPSAVWTIRPEVVMSPRAATFAPRRRVNLRDAVGCVSAEQFCPYPPGVPLIGPGERVTSEVVEAIEIAGQVGRVAYSSDATLATIEVVAE